MRVNQSILLCLLLSSCESGYLGMNKRLPDEFLVKSNPALIYPKEYKLVEPMHRQDKLDSDLDELSENDKKFLQDFYKESDDAENNKKSSIY